MNTDKTKPLSLIQGGKREPQLTDAELAAIRRMLAQHACITEQCPVAARCLSTR